MHFSFFTLLFISSYTDTEKENISIKMRNENIQKNENNEKVGIFILYGLGIWNEWENPPLYFQRPAHSHKCRAISVC